VPSSRSGIETPRQPSGELGVIYTRTKKMRMKTVVLLSVIEENEDGLSSDSSIQSSVTTETGRNMYSPTSKEIKIR
jgi:hypothetical protein